MMRMCAKICEKQTEIMLCSRFSYEFSFSSVYIFMKCSTFVFKDEENQTEKSFLLQ